MAKSLRAEIVRKASLREISQAGFHALAVGGLKIVGSGRPEYHAETIATQMPRAQFVAMSRN